MPNFKDISPHPFLNQDKSESGENEKKELEHETGPGVPAGWTGFNGSGAGVTSHLAGLLAQNGQNGGSSSVSDQL